MDEEVKYGGYVDSRDVLLLSELGKPLARLRESDEPNAAPELEYFYKFLPMKLLYSIGVGVLGWNRKNVQIGRAHV